MKTEWEKLRNLLSVTADVASIFALFGVTAVGWHLGYAKDIIIVIIFLVCLIIIAIPIKLRKISGITEFHQKLKHASVDNIIQKAKNSVDILGISLRLMFEDNTDIDNIITEKFQANEHFNMRFLIINPESKYIEKQAEQENANLKDWKNHIEETKKRLTTIKGKNPSRKNV
jgi:hypothetical protein